MTQVTEMEIKTDAALTEALSALSDADKGIGGIGLSQTNNNHLDEKVINDLQRNSSLMNKVATYLPLAANSCRPIWTLLGTEATSEDVSNYVENIRVINNGKGKHYQDFYELVKHASINARLYGDCFIVLGVNDGQELIEPVDMEAVQSVEWAVLTEKRYVSYNSYNDTYYVALNKYTNSSGDKINATQVHSSRILRFIGTEIYGEAYENNSYMNDSVYKQILRDYSVYRNSVDSVAQLMKTHDTFVLTLPTLTQAIAKGNFKAIYDRMKSIIRSRSVMGGLFLQKGETAEAVTHSYSTIDKILGIFINNLVASSCMTKTKLLGSSEGSALSSQGESDRFEWANCVNVYQVDHQLPQYKQLTALILAANDFPVSEDSLEGWLIKFPSLYAMSPETDADYRNKVADYFGKLLDKGLISPSEARKSLFANTEFSIEVELDNAEWEATQNRNEVEESLVENDIS